ncbi:MAG TPA: DUF4231 domain-containing protein [Edaphobacter sp.]|nr:DUF4231 domain-containing protein [Edaphobacter sp.]
MTAQARHLHTYFLFPFSIDKEAVKLAHPEIWSRKRRWLEGLDEWLANHSPLEQGGKCCLGSWTRDAYTTFDSDSQAYQDMIFFHPFMRRVFFDIRSDVPSEEALFRCYSLPNPHNSSLWYEVKDFSGAGMKIEVTDLRLFLFANGIGILSLGVEARNLPISRALWINEIFRKIYPSSAEQVRDGRMPLSLSLTYERGGIHSVIAEHDFSQAKMSGVLPPLSSTLTALLYFADYSSEEFEPVFDARMVVYSYLEVDKSSVPEDFADSEAYQVLIGRFLFVDRDGLTHRYSPQFVRRALENQLYTRWANEGTYYGFTSYSCVAITLMDRDSDPSDDRRRNIVHKMFDTRYYLMSLVALFYRATLLDFAERTALVSKRLYLDQWDGELDIEDLRIADGLEAEFLHFSNHWYFTEVANRDEGIEHFDMQCREYRTHSMFEEVAAELDRLNASLHNYYQFRNTEAVNRLGMLSMILGVGAVITGFFGMNFQLGDVSEAVLHSTPQNWLPWVAAIVATVISVGAILFGVFLVGMNWSDYRDTLMPNRWKAARVRKRLVKRGAREY